MSTWFKDRLNYLSARFAGRAGWTDKSLDFVPIAYYKGGFNSGDVPMMLMAQVGRSLTELLMNDAMMMQSKDRDYFIFSEDLGFEPEEGDVILDENYCTFYCKVTSRFGKGPIDFTNETCGRFRTRTVVVRSGQFAEAIPDRIATWLRTGVKVGGAGYLKTAYDEA